MGKQEGTSSRENCRVTSQPRVEKPQEDDSSRKKQWREEKEAETGNNSNDKLSKKEFKVCFCNSNE